jgi:DNA modification methylase
MTRKEAVIADKIAGVSDAEIGKKYKITYRELEKIIRESVGISVSAFKEKKKVTRLQPSDFKEEATTVWSFKSRGNWATHSGEYRGNWSPYIPRNVILKYSQPGDLVLDYFCGAGTTAVEAKLLGRKSIALDINDKAIELARENIDFVLSTNGQTYEPELFAGDARDLSFLNNNSVDLICSHPPYTNIIHYTENKEGDLSCLDTEHFLKEMERVANESYRVLKSGRQCAILIGDMRRHKHVIPLGFKLINIYLNAGFKLKELIIKRQHNCKTTGFWYANSIKFNFLLLGHEYLPIFEKPFEQSLEIKEQVSGYGYITSCTIKPLIRKKIENMETTTVWIFPDEDYERFLNKNVIERYEAGNGYKTIDIAYTSEKKDIISKKNTIKDLLFIKSSGLDKQIYSHQDINLYLNQLKNVFCMELPFIKKGGYVVIQTRDVRIGEYAEPLAKHIVDTIKFSDLLLKEIVVVVRENHNKNKLKQEDKEGLSIAHQYLLVYKKKD